MSQVLFLCKLVVLPALGDSRSPPVHSEWFPQGLELRMSLNSPLELRFSCGCLCRRALELVSVVRFVLLGKSVLIGLSTRMDRRLLEPSGDPALEDRDEKHDGAEPRLNSRCVLVRVRDLQTLAPRSPLPKLSFACEAFLAVSVHPPAASEVGTVAVDFTAAAAAGSGAAGPAAANSAVAG